jgi:hypothetical protein
VSKNYILNPFAPELTTHPATLVAPAFEVAPPFKTDNKRLQTRHPFRTATLAAPSRIVAAPKTGIKDT